MNFKASSGDNSTIPQSRYSDQGESAKVDWLTMNSVTLFGNINLPYKIEVSTQFDAHTGAPYNITTGTDNNGDGVFNDRRSFAPGAASGPGVYATRFGSLTKNVVNGNVPRNASTMPGLIHLDMNINRAFTLNPKKKADPLTMTSACEAQI